MDLDDEETQSNGRTFLENSDTQAGDDENSQSSTQTISPNKLSNSSSNGATKKKSKFNLF